MYRGLTSSSLGVVLSLGAVVAGGISYPAPAIAATFTDVDQHWARPFIEQLADANVIAGFPDGTFRPNQPVTRAQFAAIVRQAFNQSRVREYRGFNDVPTNFWATPAIQKAFETGFLSGYPGGLFLPNQEIPKVQVLVSLASGLRLPTSPSPETVLRVFQDAQDIPTYAQPPVAAATTKGIVVNYPNVGFLNPNETATRGDVAAYIYQALVNQGRFQPISRRDPAFKFIVGAAAPTPPKEPPATGDTSRLPKGTTIPLIYPGARNARIIIAAGETVRTTLQVPSRVVAGDGTNLLPEGSRVTGRFIPVTVNGVAGAQFVAERLSIPRNPQSYDLQAASRPKTFTRTQDIPPQSLRGAIITQAAQRVIQGAFGPQVSTTDFFSGILDAVLGTPRVNSNQVIVFAPADLTITLQTPLRINPRSPNPQPNNLQPQ
uniref:S-layer domain protein n=1 Tax=Cyanothece sp. (strain PCC 7425 / ATCC 29141) TaxID=395961 RepID=B8HV14_CYAP4